MKLVDEVKIALELLEKKGFEGFLVGGCVRDYLMNKIPKDIDIATDAEPFEIIDIFNNYKVIETGIKHGTVTVIINSLPLEITTYRIDGEYSDNRRPDEVIFSKSLKDDVSRRDFTINAIAYNPKTGLIDYFDGIKDIRDKKVRSVGDANTRFNEDSLRILRGIRFASVLGFNIEEQTKFAMLKNKMLLKNVSFERVAVEFIKTLYGDNMQDVMMEFYSIWGVLIPELLQTVGFEQRNKYHIYDVFEHSIITAKNMENKPHLKLAGLFHDIGKPKTFSVDEKGIGHFYGHPEYSTKIVGEILSRLKFDNFTKERVMTLIKHHDVPIEICEKYIKRWLNKLTPEVFFELIDLKVADNLAQNPEFLYRQNELLQIKRIAKKILKEKQCFSLRDLCIDGNDLIGFGFRQGIEIGQILNKILNMVINNEISNDYDIIVSFIKNNYIDYRNPN